VHNGVGCITAFSSFNRHIRCNPVSAHASNLTIFHCLHQYRHQPVQCPSALDFRISHSVRHILTSAAPATKITLLREHSPQMKIGLKAFLNKENWIYRPVKNLTNASRVLTDKYIYRLRYDTSGRARMRCHAFLNWTTKNQTMKWNSEKLDRRSSDRKSDTDYKR